MVTLQDIWNKTQDFTYSTSSSPRYISTSSSPLASFKSLQDVWDSLTENPITSNIILSGNTVMGVAGGASAGITWLPAEATAMDWATASSTCVAKGNGARLPTMGELIRGYAGQIGDYPQTNSGFLEDIPHWSSTVSGSGASAGAAHGGGQLETESGYLMVTYQNKSSAEPFVRCVR
jgi:hypothetical protein